MTPRKTENRHLDHQRDGSVAYRPTSVNGAEPFAAPVNDNAGACGAVGILIDGPNLYRAARSQGASPDIRRIVETVASGRRWFGTACLVRPVDGRSIDGVIAAYSRVGFRVVVWEPVLSCGEVKGNNDTQIVVEGMDLLADPEVADLCIVSGDSDLRVLADKARRFGKGASLARFQWRRAAVLASAVDSEIVLGTDHLLGLRDA